jgi:pimeloyl-ACP methyl ester carboxylesterase
MENPRVRVATYRAPNFVFVEHEFELPLDHTVSDGPTITVFAREVVTPTREHDELPWLVFLQGGPGSEAPRLLKLIDQTWWERALKDYRLLLLDQRGTGRSSPVGAPPDMSAEEQADYLTHFRADSIVRDAEAIRKELGIEKWSVLGQSFGGFCVVNYLAQAPEGLAEALVTGGLPPLDRHPDDVYRATYERARAKNRAYYERYPEDRERVLRIVERVESEDVRLPSGDRLTARWFRQVGHVLGMSYGAETVHYLVELPFGSPAFLHDVERSQTFARNPLYGVIHEACYAPGVATRWSAERVFPDELRDDPTFLTGEHIYPWMFEEYGALRPWAEAAQILADHEWPALYDVARLAENEVPVAAAIYAEDMYVPREFSEETAARIPGLRTWLTNEYEHDGLRANGERVLGKLLDLVQGRA